MPICRSAPETFPPPPPPARPPLWFSAGGGVGGRPRASSRRTSRRLPRPERSESHCVRSAARCEGNELIKTVRKCQSCMVSNLPARTRRRGWRWRRGWWARCCPEGSPPPRHRLLLRAPEKKTLREQHSRSTQSTHMHTRVKTPECTRAAVAIPHLGQPHSTHKKHA